MSFFRALARFTPLFSVLISSPQYHPRNLYLSTPTLSDHEDHGSRRSGNGRLYPGVPHPRERQDDRGEEEQHLARCRYRTLVGRRGERERTGRGTAVMLLPMCSIGSVRACVGSVFCNGCCRSCKEAVGLLLERKAGLFLVRPAADVHLMRPFVCSVPPEHHIALPRKKLADCWEQKRPGEND